MSYGAGAIAPSLTADDFARLLAQRGPGLPQGFGLDGPNLPAGLLGQIFPGGAPSFTAPEAQIRNPLTQLVDAAPGGQEPGSPAFDGAGNRTMASPTRHQAAPSVASFGGDPAPSLGRMQGLNPDAGAPRSGGLPSMAPRAADVPTTGTLALPPAGQPSAPTAEAPTVAPARSGPGFLEMWKGLADTGIGDQLLALSSGLLSSRGGAGWSKGFENMQRAGAMTSASNLAQAEYGLKQQKLAQQATGNNATVALLVSGGHAPEAATAMVQAAGAGHSDALNNALNNLVPKAKDAEALTVGGNKYWLKPGQTPGDANLIGPAEAEKDQWQLVDVPMGGGQTQKQWVKKGEAAGTAVGQPSAPDKPQGFDVETKLRGEFAKGLGTFGNVHDGYGRVIAATKQREANPGSVSPASDISLVFGYMKMLDPGSVVREGEYATAKNAAGVPERVLNAYNKALNGEFLSDTQRKDFLGQAAELYGTSRKTAEGVTDRYRGLAQQYGVSPERSVYLPELPTPPQIGRQSQTPAANPLDAARAAIARGAPREAVIGRLRQNGIDAGGL